MASGADPYGQASWLLAGLGATPTGGGGADLALGRADLPGGVLVDRLADGGPALVAAVGAGLPASTLTYACGLALAAAALAARRAGRAVEVSELGVAVQIRLPEVMAAAYRSPVTMRPGCPRGAPGGGWYHADLGSPGDAEMFDTLLTTLAPTVDAGHLAVAAQEWRLPVCDYRPRDAGRPAGPPLRFEPGGPAAPSGGGGPGPGRREARPGGSTRPGPARPLEAVVVTDLTAMWAGPLATWILQELGAQIHKIEPARRPDGFRATAGGGIYPGGVQVAPGQDSAMWNALNHGKPRLDLDLGDPDQRERFLGLAAGADLVIDSFSPRVMANFGLDRELAGLAGRPVWLSIPAFPPGPMRSWVAYGTGVHALSGHGDTGDGRFAAPPVSYPDPLAGLSATLGALAGLTARERGAAATRVEASLYDAVPPLGTAPIAGAADAADTGPLLLEAARSRALMEPRPVAGALLEHPRCPLR